MNTTADNIKSKDTLHTIGDIVTFMCGNEKKKGIIAIVDAYGTFEKTDIRSYDIWVEDDNMLYKHVTGTWIIQ